MVDIEGTSLHAWQRRVLVISSLAYASMYLGRTNMAVALPGIQGTHGLSTSAAGMMGTAFFWVYAIGQLINGHLGDSLPGRSIVFWGLLGTGLVNLLVGFMPSFSAILLLWAVNGYLQSTGWGPIVKTVSNWTPPESRGKVSGLLGVSPVVGFLISWFLSNRLLTWFKGDWRFVFVVPGVLLLSYSVIWYALIRNRPQEVGLPPVNDDMPLPTPPPEYVSRKGRWKAAVAQIRLTYNFVKRPQLLILAAVTWLQGLVKDGVTLWGPTLLMQSQGLALEDAATLSLWIPVFGIMGIGFSSWLTSLFRGHERKSLILLYGAAAVAAFCGMSVLTRGYVLLTTIAIALVSAFAYGINTVLLASIPLKFAGYGRQSTVAGFLDFASYLGAAVTGIATGYIVDCWGWTYVVGMWSAVCLAGGVLIAAARLDMAPEKTPASGSTLSCR